MISNSGSDERRKFKGGKAGDQTGGEWRIIPWYNRPWNVVLRHPDEKVRKEIAKLAKAAANNNKIGYDQSQRHTYWQQLSKSNYDPAKIKTACEADCSAGVLANCKATGYRLNIAALKNIDQNGYTGSMKKILKKAGFTVLTAKKYLTSDKYLLEGDIILAEGHHTATNLTNGTLSGTTSSTNTTSTAKPITPSASSDSVAQGQQWLNSNFGTLIKNATGSLLAIDNNYGSHSRLAALAVWKYTVNKSILTSKNKLTPSNKNFGDSCKKAASKAVIKKGKTGTFVYIAQFILAAKGYYTGKLDADFGSKTDTAVRAFQKANGLVIDGCVGPLTWYKLFN